MALNVHLRVLDLKKKSKFAHFTLTKVPKFQYPEELKSYLLHNHGALISPAETLNFSVGYFVEGKGNRKYDIVDSTTLQQAYKNVQSGRVCLWVDPHCQPIGSSNAKKHSNNDSNEDSAASSKKKRKDEIFEKLKEDHGNEWPDFKLQCWASMLTVGTHYSSQVPPDVPFFGKILGKKKGKVSEVPVINKNDTRASLLKQLKDLNDLRKDEVLTVDEFQQQRATIVKELQDL